MVIRSYPIWNIFLIPIFHPSFVEIWSFSRSQFWEHCLLIAFRRHFHCKSLTVFGSWVDHKTAILSTAKDAWHWNHWIGATSGVTTCIHEQSVSISNFLQSQKYIMDYGWRWAAVTIYHHLHQNTVKYPVAQSGCLIQVDPVPTVLPWPRRPRDRPVMWYPLCSRRSL